MSKWIIFSVVIVVLVGGAYLLLNSQDSKQDEKKEITQSQELVMKTDEVTPINHATFVLRLGGQIIYNDPVGGTKAFVGQPDPNIILVSDIHPDHLDNGTLKAISKENTILVVPQAVADELSSDIRGKIVILANGETSSQNGIGIEAMPMYNMPESKDSPHTKGRGNGYILSADGKRIYIAGDTGATPEMKALKNIDEAFIPMNLPYTMSVEEAAQGVLAFKPEVVHPYHYKGVDGFSDINKFKELVEKGDPNIKVVLLDFYPNTK